uniref:C2H2-type domain-containing protein n=1 Tax=Anopheles farauti TaxID=69004 RepID=A0A182QZ41_9DIPT
MVSTICKECVAKVCTVRAIRDEFAKQNQLYREMLQTSNAKDDSEEEKIPEQKQIEKMPELHPDPSSTVESTTEEDQTVGVKDTDDGMDVKSESDRVDCSDSNTVVFYLEQSNDKEDQDTQNSDYELLVTHPERYEEHLCESCSAMFTSQDTLNKHMRSRHLGSHKCRFCNKQLPSAYALKSHENTHTKQQTFTCPECGRMFTQYTSMRRHMALHNDVKAYECEFCQQRFRQRSVMLAHRRRHTGEKPCVCDVCDKSFREHSALAKHKRLHTQQTKADQKNAKQQKESNKL